MIAFALPILLTGAFGQAGDTANSAIPIIGSGPHFFDMATATDSGNVLTPDNKPDLFFAWAAPVTGWYRLTTCGTSSGVPGIVRVSPGGSTDPNVSTMTCDGDRASFAFLAAQGGANIFAISQMDLAQATAGTFLIEPFVPASNGTCSQAEVFSGSGPYSFDHTDVGPSLFGGISMWYEWTAPASGVFEYSAVYDNANNSPTVEFYDACGGPVFSTGLAARNRMVAVAGNTYLINIAPGEDMWGGSMGTFAIGQSQDEPTGPVVIRPTTGHAYTFVSLQTSWPEAKAIAENTYFRGVPGHLVTYSNGAEDEFVRLEFLAVGGGNLLTWIGYWQDPNDPQYSEPGGGWKWITGESDTYTDWGTGKPNGFAPEAYAMDFGNSWDDERAISSGFGAMFSVIEWDLNVLVEEFCSPAQPNSTGLSTRMTLEETPAAGAGARLLIESAPPNQFGYFLVGDGFADPGISIGGGEFCLAVGASNVVGRYNFMGTSRDSIGLTRPDGTLENLVGTSASGSGYDIPLELPFPGSPVINAGATYHYQFWHREAGGSTNFSNGLSLTF